jgi:hypothetical protein
VLKILAVSNTVSGYVPRVAAIVAPLANKGCCIKQAVEAALGELYRATIKAHQCVI